MNLETGDIEGVVKFENGASVMIVGGNNIGRVGILQHIEKHQGSHDIAHIKDANNHHFATRLSNIFIIGEGKKPMISLLKGNGLKLTPLEELNQA